MRISPEQRAAEVQVEKEKARRHFEPDGPAKVEVSHGLTLLEAAVFASTNSPIPGRKTRPAVTYADLRRWLVQVAICESRDLPIRVAIVLMDYAARRAPSPKHGQIAEVLGVVRRTVQTAIGHLQDGGHLAVTTTRGRGRASTYTPMLRSPR